MIRAIPVAHQFLSKPCDPDVLHNVIQRACQLQDLINDEALRSLMGRIDSLPSPPKIYWELTAALADPGVSMESVAAIIEQDPALAAKLLQLVNSPYFGIAKPVLALRPAVAYLGFELIRGVVLTAHILRTFDGAPPIPGCRVEHLQSYALVTAKVARRLVPRGDAAEQAFTAALLHDVGKIVIAAAFPDRFAEVLRASESGEKLFHEAEREMLGFGHAEVGAYLLALWGLPHPIVEAAAYHHTPTRVAQRGFELVGIVHVADAIVDACLPPLRGITCPHAQLDLAYLETLGVAAQLPTWRRIAEAEARAWGAAAT
jgi:putative nucleotidyltransferase with HDIG domain